MAGDLNTDEEKKLADLMAELDAAKNVRRKAEINLAIKRFKELEKAIEESGDVYLRSSAKNKELVKQYRESVARLKAEYKGRAAQIDDDEKAYETDLQEDRAELAKQKGNLHELRKLPIIKELESAIKERESLEKQLNETVNDEEKGKIEAKIKNIKAREQQILGSDAGQEYKKTRDGIESSKDKIKNDKKNIKNISNLREELSSWVRDYTKKAKETLEFSRGKQLPAKQSKLMQFIGGIRAKLGIGKYKAEKNVADTIKNAIGEAENMIKNVGEFSKKRAELAAEAIKNGAEHIKESAIATKDAVINGATMARDTVVGGAKMAGQAVVTGVTAAKDAVIAGGAAVIGAASDFYDKQKQNIIAGMRNHIQKRIEREKQKTQNLQKKLDNLDAGERQ